ncbi:MAG: hypothetical protein Q8K79_12365 [Solirubrobacteraceae bacterium]|nr:hypothetical protein [Solirubrobacteraceae bacterium]
MAAISSTISPAGPVTAPSAAPEPATLARPTALAIVRAFGVMVGGPLLLVAAAAAAGLHSLRAALAHRPPRPGALGVVAAAAAYAGLVRPWMRRWGASDADLARALPGDDVCPDPGLEQTHAIAIDAPAEDVWPWVAQLGQDRGGFYSYTFLENLAGCRMRNADRIHPEWQDRRVGDTVLLHPSSGLEILRLDAGRAIVFEGGWALAIEPDGPGRCRLLARFRFPRGALSIGYALLLELPHFVMERKMLLEIKRRAEAAR